jgi:hypothetical protein
VSSKNWNHRFLSLSRYVDYLPPLAAARLGLNRATCQAIMLPTKTFFCCINFSTDMGSEAMLLTDICPVVHGRHRHTHTDMCAHAHTNTPARNAHKKKQTKDETQPNQKRTPRILQDVPAHVSRQTTAGVRLVLQQRVLPRQLKLCWLQHFW